MTPALAALHEIVRAHHGHVVSARDHLPLRVHVPPEAAEPLVTLLEAAGWQPQRRGADVERIDGCAFHVCQVYEIPAKPER